MPRSLHGADGDNDVLRCAGDGWSRMAFARARCARWTRDHSVIVVPEHAPKLLEHPESVDASTMQGRALDCCYLRWCMLSCLADYRGGRAGEGLRGVYW